jgi:hypothetical protein
MAVAKLTASKKGFGLIDDEGNYFITSADFVRKLLAGEWKGDIILLKRLPIKVDTSRFQKSPVWEPDKPLPSLAELREQAVGDRDLLHADRRPTTVPFEDKVKL